MTECIIIPQWVFAVVGVIISVPSTTVLYIQYKLVPEENIMLGALSAVVLALGIIFILIGIEP